MEEDSDDSDMKRIISKQYAEENSDEDDEDNSDDQDMNESGEGESD